MITTLMQKAQVQRSQELERRTGKGLLGSGDASKKRFELSIKGCRFVKERSVPTVGDICRLAAPYIAVWDVCNVLMV